jgi:hypothetical protein
MHLVDGYRKPSGCAPLRIGETHPAGRLPFPVQPRPLALAAVAVPASPFGPRARRVRPSPRGPSLGADRRRAYRLSAGAKPLGAVASTPALVGPHLLAARSRGSGRCQGRRGCSAICLQRFRPAGEPSAQPSENPTASFTSPAMLCDLRCDHESGAGSATRRQRAPFRADTPLGAGRRVPGNRLAATDPTRKPSPPQSTRRNTRDLPAAFAAVVARCPCRGQRWTRAPASAAALEARRAPERLAADLAGSP